MNRLALSVFGAIVVASVAGCGGGGSGDAGCVPADSQAVTDIGVVLDAYPEFGASLSGNAQQVAASVPLPNGAGSEYSALIAAKLEPSGDVGVWGVLTRQDNGAYLGIQPVNPAAVSVMPEAAPLDSSWSADVAASGPASAVVACVRGG